MHWHCVFFVLHKHELLYLQIFHFQKRFGKEATQYPDCQNNPPCMAAQKGLPPALRRQQALSTAPIIFIAVLFQTAHTAMQIFPHHFAQLAKSTGRIDLLYPESWFYS